MLTGIYLFCRDSVCFSPVRERRYHTVRDHGQMFNSSSCRQKDAVMINIYSAKAHFREIPIKVGIVVQSQSI